MLPILLILSSLELYSQYTLKLAAEEHNTASDARKSKFLLGRDARILLGISLYVVTTLIYFYGLIHYKFGSLTVGWHVIMAVIASAIGIFVFNEKYSTQELIGLVLGTASIFLLHTHHH